MPSGAVSPLELFASRQLAPAEPMFVIEADEPVLDAASWSSTGSTVRGGRAMPPTARAAPSSMRCREWVSARTRCVRTSRSTGSTGPWLPVTGDPTRVEGVSFRIDPASGSLLATAGDALGADYTVHASVPVSEVALLQALPVATDDEALAALEPRPASRRSCRRWRSSPPTAAARRCCTLRCCRTTCSARSSVTSSTRQATRTVTWCGAFTEVGAGTEEQFASAFAVLGRIVGLPTRVVVGFGPGELQADGSYRVRAGDARVWPEVKFDGAGWVPFDPSPA